MVGACTVTGAHTFNFTAIVSAFLEADALVQLPPLSGNDAPRALANVFTELLADEERRRAIGGRARAVMERNRGATERTIRMLAPLFQASNDSSPKPRIESATSDALSA
jgi:3-deoxy-D-manno-octulosonic-acid transferase